MGCIQQSVIVIGLAAVLATQGCAFAPKPPDPEQKNAAFERWNRCLQRFQSNPAHYCDGHRRDVLANYPVHMESQINTLLRQKTRVTRVDKMMRTGMARSVNTSQTPTVEVPAGLGTNAE